MCNLYMYLVLFYVTFVYLYSVQSDFFLLLEVFVALLGVTVVAVLMKMYKF